jgi:mRNA interferase RelE/StbE
MKIQFTSKFYKDIDKIKLKSVKNNILNVIDVVESANKISEIKNLKKIKGHSIAYRIRMGDYRIGLFIENDIVEFGRIAHRKDIYILFP